MTMLTLQQLSLSIEDGRWANVAIDHRAADGEAGGRLPAALAEQIAAPGEQHP